jgi:hypothetical protein
LLQISTSVCPEYHHQKCSQNGMLSMKKKKLFWRSECSIHLLAFFLCVYSVGLMRIKCYEKLKGCMRKGQQIIWIELALATMPIWIGFGDNNSRDTHHSHAQPSWNWSLDFLMEVLNIHITWLKKNDLLSLYSTIVSYPL